MKSLIVIDNWTNVCQFKNVNININIYNNNSKIVCYHSRIELVLHFKTGCRKWWTICREIFRYLNKHVSASITSWKYYFW